MNKQTILECMKQLCSGCRAGFPLDGKMHIEKEKWEKFKSNFSDARELIGLEALFSVTVPGIAAGAIIYNSGAINNIEMFEGTGIALMASQLLFLASGITSTFYNLSKPDSSLVYNHQEGGSIKW